MEITVLYLLVGFFLSASLYAVADSRPFLLSIVVCIAWFPLLILGMTLAPFMNEGDIANKQNR
ncbi:hypothetical protein [Bacillus niameyensis]|uniref:hypothetical protein n=1 Tax=Bacillus niameyensis TaxID=1522308 RepID=UPI00078679D2|nr:hypothetical protein [Bacillus niameyensis]